MISVWILLLYVMADVMGHGGDGAGQDPPGGGWGGSDHGHYEESPDLGPKKKTRGKGKNLKLRDRVKLLGPLPLTYDRDATFTPVGEVKDYLAREAGMYMWRNISLNRRSWTNVSDAEKNALARHLAAYIALAAPQDDPDVELIKAGQESVLIKSYNNQKGYARKKYKAMVNKHGVDYAAQHPPEGMSRDNWNSLLEYWETPEFKKVSSANTTNRAKQVAPNRGGTSSYSSTVYKKDWTRYEAFCKAHMKADGSFDNPVNEEKCRRLREKLQDPESEFHDDITCSEGPDELAVFQEVLGSRGGWIPGIGHKPPSRTPGQGSSSAYQFTPPPPPPPQLTEEFIDDLINHPHYQQRLKNMFQSSQNEGSQDGDDTDEE